MNRGHSDTAADTIIGFILVTAIALASITIVLLWGQPALDRAQTAQDFDAMVRSMGTLDTELTSLYSGAPATTTPVWRVSMARGTLDLDETGHVWAFAVDLETVDMGSATDKSLGYVGLADGDNEIYVQNQGTDTIDDLQVVVYQWNGAFRTVLTGTPDASLLGPTTSTRVVLSQPVEGRSIEIHWFDGDPDGCPDNCPIGKLYIADTGALQWTLDAGGQRQEVAYENTGVITKVDDGYALRNDPQLRPPRQQNDTIENIFLRVVRFNGTLSLAERASNEILLSSGGNHIRFSHPDVLRVQIYPASPYQVAWQRLLDDDLLGYTFDIATNSFNGDESLVARRASAPQVQIAASVVETPITVEVVARR